MAKRVNGVNNPKHYCGDGHITARVAMRSMLTNAKQKPMVISWWSMAFKYLWRWHLKNGVEDLDKCIDCIEKMKEEMGVLQETVSPRVSVHLKTNESVVICPTCGAIDKVDEDTILPNYCSNCGQKYKVAYMAMCEKMRHE